MAIRTLAPHVFARPAAATRTFLTGTGSRPRHQPHLTPTPSDTRLSNNGHHPPAIMARGLQKIEAQQKAQAAGKKGGNSTLKKDKGLKYQCTTCKAEVDNIANMKIHWSAKHPKLDTPTDEFASMLKAPVEKK